MILFSYIMKLPLIRDLLSVMTKWTVTAQFVFFPRMRAYCWDEQADNTGFKWQKEQNPTYKMPYKLKQRKIIFFLNNRRSWNSIMLIA